MSQNEHHMSYTLREAAKASGKSKATIGRAVQSGRLSAVKDEATGAWRIDPAELHRVFPPRSSGQVQDGSLSQSDVASETVETAGLLRQERHERERERVQLQTRIDDLTHRLDDSEKERRTVQTQLTALLTDQRPKARRWLPSAVIIVGLLLAAAWWWRLIEIHPPV
jgi:hypothetical protein